MGIAADAPSTPEELFLRWRDGGDVGAMADLFEAEAPTLFRTAVAICSDPALAEEAVQETFLTAMESADRWDRSRRTGPWLTGILRNKILELRRRAARRPDPRRLPPPPAPEDPVVASAMAEDVERVRAAIRRLPEPYRAVALLRWCHGLEPAAIADLRGEPPGTVWSTLSRAMARLRKDLGALAILAPLHPEPRGLDAVRGTVLDAARRLRPPAAAAAAPTRARRGVPAAAALAGAVLVVAAASAPFPGGPDAPPAAPTREAAPGAVVAERPREATAPAPATAEAEEDAPPPPVDLEAVDRDHDLAGLVVDAAGAPVANATVRTQRRVRGDVYFLDIESTLLREPGPGTRTARDGTFVVTAGRGEALDVRVETPDGLVAAADWRLAGERLRLVARPRARLAVRVLDAEGLPLEGARVRASWPDETGRTSHAPPALTDADGRCRFDDLHRPGVLLAFSHRAGRSGGPAVVALVPGEETVHEQRLLPSHPASGFVTDAATGAPLPGARVGEGNHQGNEVVTDADGAFTLPLHAGGPRALVVVTAEGRTRGVARVDAAGVWRAALRHGSAVEGRVLVDAAPVADVAVLYAAAAASVDGQTLSDAGATATDREGRFRLDHLAPGAAYSLVVEARGRGRLVRDFRAPPGEGGEEDLGDIDLPPACRVEGVVVDATGAPLPDVPVVLRDPRPAAGGRLVEEIARRTDDLGRFRFAGRAPGSYRVIVPPAGGRFAAEATVTVAAGADVLDARIVAGEGRPVRVRVLFDDGAPVAGAVLHVVGHDGTARATTDAEGRASLCVPPEGTARIGLLDRVAPPRFVAADPAGTAVGPAATEATVVARPAGTARGRVVDADGTGAARAWVGLRDPATGATFGAWTAVDGSFGIAAPADVPLEAWARTASGVRSTAALVRAPADGILLRVPPRGTGTLEIRVEDPDGRPVRGARLVAPPDPNGRLPATDARGRALLRDLGPGGVRIEVLPASSLPAGLFPPPAATAVAGPDPVTVRLVAGVAVEGEVLGPEGLPAAGATVRLDTAGGHVARAVADAGGRFRAWIPPGDRVIRAGARGAVPADAPDGLPAGPLPRALLEGDAAAPPDLRFHLR